MQGLLLLNKPEGITSFGAVARIKRLAHERRVGHTGTLDPMASGVLPIFIGRATALSGYLLDADKSYTARIKLGIATDSCDITGNVISEREVTANNEEIIKAVESFIGKQKQVPPMFSALKKDGVRLYELARKGETIDIPPRDIEVYSALVSKPLDDNNEFCAEFTVSKGTYIRSLCRDIGEALGCGATLTALCRTSASGFELKQCANLSELTDDNIGQYIMSEDAAVGYMPQINVTEKQAIRFCNGGQLAFERLKLACPENGQLFRIKFGDKLLGLGFADCENQQIAVKCVINSI